MVRLSIAAFLALAVFACTDAYDGNGYIDFREYQDMLTIMGQPMSADEAAETFSTIDTDCDGLVSFEEFIAWWQALWYED